jgi:RNA polymerase sigma-70 factor, ECF subfamily
VNDDRLLERAIAGDAAAERALYEAHVERVYRLAYRFAGSEDLAQDFTQEAFIRAFERLSEFRGESSFATWLHAITVSVSLNGLRRTRRIDQRSAPLDEALAIDGGRREAEPDLKERLWRAVDALPEGYRTVFVLHDVEGHTHEEIGRLLGIEAGTSKAQLSRARGKLRVALAAYAKEWVS